MIELPQNPNEKRKVLTSLWRLSAGAGQKDDFRVIVEWLGSESLRIDREMRHQRDGVNLAWQQGAAQLLEKFFHFTRNCKQIYDAMEQQKQGGSRDEGIV